MYESDLWRVVWRPPPPLPVRHVEWLTVRAQWLTLWPVLGPSVSRWKFTTISVICDNLVTRNPLTFSWRTGRCGWSAAGKIYCSGENEGIDPPSLHLASPSSTHNTRSLSACIRPGKSKYRTSVYIRHAHRY